MRKGFGHMKILKSVIGLLAGCLLALSGCRKAESYEKPLTPVKVRNVEERQVSVGAARYSANIKPESQVDLAFRTSGYVDMIARVAGRTIREGDRVTKGALLASIRDADFAARVKGARASLAEAIAAQKLAESQLAEARAAQANARVELERAEKLFATDSMAKPEHDAVKTRFEMGEAGIEASGARLSMALARVDAARAQVEEAETALSNCELRAPATGVIVRRNIEVGTLASPGVAAMTLADVNSVKVVFGVPDVETPNLGIGSILTVRSEAVKDVDFRGRLTNISPSADPKTRIFDVEVRIPNPGNRLKIGMVVSLEVAGETKARPVTVVPLSAVIQMKEKGAGYAVFSIDNRDGRAVARLRRVTLGAPLGDMLTVNSGLEAGEQVIVSGTTLVGDGEEVKVVSSSQFPVSSR